MRSGERRALTPFALALALATLPPLAGQGGIRFRDVAEQAGLNFVLRNNPTEEKHLIETMGGGVAALDFDRDGRVDLFFANGASLPSFRKAGPDHWNRLYRNLGGLRFEDVTERSGLEGRGYCTGAAAADYDNDGDVDLFVACLPAALLYRNDDVDGFREVSREAGLFAVGWPIGGAWLDYDLDGRLDLFVVNYLQWSPDFDTYCGDPKAGVRSYCDPTLFDGLPNRLYRNVGDGAFLDVSGRSGIGSHVGKGMSAAPADYDGDGHIDVFVTNDKTPNFLFRNLGDGSFDEVALLAGVALQDHGKAVSAMGADFNDYDNDGHPDVIFSALAGESFPLFRNTQSGSFRDATYRANLGRLTHDRSGWGIGLADFDNDGWKDVFTANSHVNDTVEYFEATRYKLENSVFRNDAQGSFQTVPDAGLGAARAHRGSAFADFDGDGRVDVVVTVLGERAELWRNITAGDGTWIGLQLVGTGGNRDGIGARIRIGTQYSHMSTSAGYVSSSHRPVHFGLGTSSRIASIDIAWPGGKSQVLNDVQSNRVISVVEP